MNNQDGFAEFNLPPAIKDAVKAMGFTTPTPIQRKAIPILLERKDILACAATGTGKTAAFGIPVVAHLLEHPKESALIIAPTRELAAQILEVLTQLALSSQKQIMKPVLLIGGESMKKQIFGLRAKPRIVVGTPGRILDHLRAGRFKPQYYTTLVLDEADRMLDMGFEPQLKKIVRTLPRDRQSLLFSATLPKEILGLAKSYQRNPVSIDVTEGGGHSKEKINQKIFRVLTQTKNDIMLEELIHRKGSVIVFSRTKRRTDRLAKFLKTYGHNVAVVHGDRSQGQRNRALEGFRNKEYRILAATDVASRGLDIPHVEHVINFDLPQKPEDYVHRIGRTARADASGAAISLVGTDELSMWHRIVKLNIGAPAISEKGGEYQKKKKNRSRPGARPEGRSGASPGRRRKKSTRNRTSIRG